MKFIEGKFFIIMVLGGILTAALSALSACVPMMVGGAVVGGTLVATDRRTPGTQLEDRGIEMRSASRIQEHLGDRVHVNVNSYNRRVLLTGEVPNAQDKQLVEKVVSRVSNIQAIVNELVVLGHSTLAQRSSDSLVTGRVKASLVDARDLYANAFLVVTERGTTYLMGKVTEREANSATEAARSTNGVQKVVRVFDIISEDELRELLPHPASASKPK